MSDRGAVLLDPAASRALGAVAWPYPPLRTTPVVHTIAFDAAAFDHGAFAAAGIDCPLAIGKAVRKRQAEYFHGRLCARAALRAFGCDGAVGTGASRQPVWPAGFVGSITHGAALAAAVVLPAAACRGVGIDIEQACADGQQALRSTVVSDAEYALLVALQDRVDIGVLLTLVFSAKESFFKAAFASVGRYFDFDAIAVRAIDLERGEIWFLVRATLGTAWPAGARIGMRFMLGSEGRVATLFAW